MATKRRLLGGRAAGPLGGRAAGPLGGRAVRPIGGRPVVITGAASGIGRSLARHRSRLDSPVAIADIDEAGLKETARSLPGPVLMRVLDVRDAADQHRFAAEVREWLPSLADRPPLAAVFNNAGVAVASSVLDADPDDDEWLRQINFDGEALLRTTPDQAAEIICRGVDRGKARILVGPDAYIFDALARVAPTHYYDVMALLEKRLRAGSR
jgi:NAD(P)-dependent dehydrogenase (short-subunit alcohol dehydrogenase family)